MPPNFATKAGGQRQLSYPLYAKDVKKLIATHAALRTLQINKYSPQHQENNTSARKLHARSGCVRHEDGKQHATALACASLCRERFRTCGADHKGEGSEEMMLHAHAHCCDRFHTVFDCIVAMGYVPATGVLSAPCLIFLLR